jgi:hypothetical protein
MKYILLALCSLISLSTFAVDDPKAIIDGVNKKFYQVQDYTADVHMAFDIPGVRIKNLKGAAFYKKPNKFRIRAKGIFFLPKQNMAQNINAMLADTKSYTAVLSGYETIGTSNCAVINIIPLNNDKELIIGKFWIDPARSLVMKSQITTRNNGTIETFNTYDVNAANGLPSKIEVRVEVGKFKMPKMFAADINKKSADKSAAPVSKTGTILLNFSNYKINTKLKDAVFTEKEE